MNAAPTRPRSVTLTLWVVFLFGMWNAGRVIVLSLNIRTLATFNTTPAPWLRLIIALGWVLLFGAAVIALRQRRPFARRVIPYLFIAYAVYELGLLLIFAQSPTARRSWLGNFLFYGFIILFSVWALNRTAVKTYFLE